MELQMTKSDSKKIPVGIIGLGRIASLLEDDCLREKPCTHAGAVSANPQCELLCGCDIDSKRRALFKNKWNVPVYASADTMLDEHPLSLLIIATHPDSHRHYCELALQYDVPVVICEKPLAATLKDAAKIALLARAGNTKIIVNHERRYSANYQQIKSYIESGKSGVLCSVRAALYMGRGRRLLDVLWHDGTHLADTIMFLSGRIMNHKKRFGAKLKAREGTAFLSGYLRYKKEQLIAQSIAGLELEDFSPAEYKKFKTKIPFVIELGAEHESLVFEIELNFSEGRIRIGNGIYEIWHSGPSPYAEGFNSLEKTADTGPDKTDYFTNMLSDAVECFRNKEQAPVSSAEDALAVIKYLNRIKKWK
ncbi:MAG: Gfo/Idh/MocA family oxidoreductase [Spirochaetaceae bacterium]|jgi:predicted dehydrogenase|nr:Gfo/Idh/MocA family oxidoreductase [Spirochaetaceae bacterium]